MKLLLSHVIDRAIVPIDHTHIQRDQFGVDLDDALRIDLFTAFRRGTRLWLQYRRWRWFTKCWRNAIVIRGSRGRRAVGVLRAAVPVRVGAGEAAGRDVGLPARCVAFVVAFGDGVGGPLRRGLASCAKPVALTSVTMLDMAIKPTARKKTTSGTRPRHCRNTN